MLLARIHRAPIWPRLAWLAAVVVWPAMAQDFSGRWIGEEDVCSDRRLEYDYSDLASTPGALPGGGTDFGTTVTRRGAWSIVLRAGKPVLLGRWQGTGTSYSLTEYFDIVPAADGRSAVIDGVSLPVAGQCGS